jgi:hypothetical protein
MLENSYCGLFESSVLTFKTYINKINYIRLIIKDK